MIFILLIAAVVFLGFSLVKQLRKAQAAEDAGVYGHDPDEPDRRTTRRNTRTTPDNAENADNGEPHPTSPAPVTRRLVSDGSARCTG